MSLTVIGDALTMFGAGTTPEYMTPYTYIGDPMPYPPATIWTYTPVACCCALKDRPADYVPQRKRYTRRRR